MPKFENVEMTPDMFDHLTGYSAGWRNMTYTWRDVSLFNLGIGAHREDLPYHFERCEGGMKAFPNFCFVPYFNNVTSSPITPEPMETNAHFRDYVHSLLGHNTVGLHMAVEATIDTPFDPYGGTLAYTDHFNGVWDRGEGKGVVADCGMDIWDAAGRHMANIHSYHYTAAFGGYGGPKFTTPKVVFPETAPDAEVVDYMLPIQANIYRLVGDTYRVHVDYDYAKSIGYEQPFMMGMSTFGFGIRNAVQAFFPYEPERINYLYGQVRNVCFPGKNMKIQMWKDGEKRIIWRMYDEDDRLLINNAIIEYK